MASTDDVAKIKAAVEEVAGRNQDEWAFGAGHREQTWNTLDERTKQDWRDRVTVREVIQELEDEIAVAETLAEIH